jgi:DNA polymerase-3 subunit gamma/tau
MGTDFCSPFKQLINPYSHKIKMKTQNDAETIQLLEVADSVAIKYKEQAAKSDLRMLIKAMDIINDCDIHYRMSKHQRLLVELTLMKIASIPYNEREGEKKKFRLKPFRSQAAQTNPRVSPSAVTPNPAPSAPVPVAAKVEESAHTSTHSSHSSNVVNSEHVIQAIESEKAEKLSPAIKSICAKAACLFI